MAANDRLCGSGAHFRHHGNTYLQQGQYEKAMVEYQKVLDLSQGVEVAEASMKAVIAHAHAKFGKRGKAKKSLAELIKMSEETNQSSPATGVSPHSIAEIYAALGQIDEAFASLDSVRSARHAVG